MGERVIVVGAGIIGLASAWHLSRNGWEVTVLERNAHPQEASVRNFGMVWPIGQPPGDRRRLALRSRALWLQALKEADLWFRQCGSIHVLQSQLERKVVEEWLAALDSPDGLELIETEEIRRRSRFARWEIATGGLYSAHELCVDPRSVVHDLARHLANNCGVKFVWNALALPLPDGSVETPDERYQADAVVVCPGIGLKQLFPELYQGHGARLCRLMMLRAMPKHGLPFAEPHLCSGLTLTHYEAFQEVPSLRKLRQHFQEAYPDQLAKGVHGLVSQHADGSITLGDSHEYAQSFTPFLEPSYERAILEYLQTFVRLEEVTVCERWHGVYCKLATKPYVAEKLNEQTLVIGGFGGAGMTLSFGATEEALQRFSLIAEAKETV